MNKKEREEYITNCKRWSISHYNNFKGAILAFHPEKGKRYFAKHPLAQPSEKDKGDLEEQAKKTETIEKIKEFLVEIQNNNKKAQSSRLYGYLLFDFPLTEDWDFKDFTIERSIEIPHGIKDSCDQEIVKSFISPVLMPNWVNNPNGQHCLLGLSAVCSFCFGRPVYAPRNDLSIKEAEMVELPTLVDESMDNLQSLINLRAVVKTKDGKKHCGVVKNVDDDSFWSKNGIKPITQAVVSVETYDSKLFSFVKFTSGKVEFQEQESEEKVNSILVQKHPEFMKLFAMSFPIIVRGNESNLTGVVKKNGKAEIESVPNAEELDRWKKRLNSVIQALYSLDFEKKGKLDYKKMMQAMRLIQLAHQNHKEDFDLSFSFLVAGIEAIAQIAIPAENIEMHKSHKKWKSMGKENKDTEELFGEYCRMRDLVNSDIKNKQLQKRFVDFIFNYYPPKKWKVEDKMLFKNGPARLYLKLRPEHFFGKNLKKFIESEFKQLTKPDKKIDNITIDKLEKLGLERLKTITKNTYGYRSKFIHTGKSTPHHAQTANPVSMYFEDALNPNLENWKELLDYIGIKIPKTSRLSKVVKQYYISHDLMKVIARDSVLNYLKSINIKIIWLSGKPK